MGSFTGIKNYFSINVAVLDCYLVVTNLLEFVSGKKFFEFSIVVIGVVRQLKCEPKGCSLTKM
jgi:hypothetical protein